MCVYCGYESAERICNYCQSELESEFQQLESEFQQLILDICDTAGSEDEE